MSEEAPRASWNFLYEKGLLEILTEHKVDSLFKGQNGWNPEGWRTFHMKFNEKFPSARYTKRQLQDKEKELKASYKAISNAKKDSGTGWNEAMGMIIVEPEAFAMRYSKIAKHRKNGFRLFRVCEALYEGSIATRDLSFTSIELPNNLTTGNLQTETSASEPRENSEANVVIPFSASDAGQAASEAQSAPCGTSTQEYGSGRKRKQSQVAAVLDDYLEHKKAQSEKTVEVLIERKNRAEEYLIEKCLDTVDAMEELTDEEKAIASEVFENEVNREVFIKQKNLNVRLIWLRRKISRLASS